MSRHIHIVFDGPPETQSGRFIEVENDTGKSIAIGYWYERPDGNWALVIPNALPKKRWWEKLPGLRI